MFHVIAHVYHSHFREVVLLSLHAHLNCVFAHFTIFNETFQLVEDKETEILQVSWTSTHSSRVDKYGLWSRYCQQEVAWGDGSWRNGYIYLSKLFFL